MCVENGIFPNKWKEAVVVLIPKGGNSKKVSNVRKISLLPALGKILENLMSQRIHVIHHTVNWVSEHLPPRIIYLLVKILIKLKSCIRYKTG